MDYAVVGGDARFAYLTRMLMSAGWDARAVDGDSSEVPGVPCAGADALAGARNVVMNWPIPEGEALLERLEPGCRVYLCGPGAPESAPEGIECVNLWRDERLLLENAWLTAEGAIASAMRASRASIRDCHCLVVGWGRIGRALTEMLVGLNARVTVASRSPKGRSNAIERGAESVSTYDLAAAMPGKQIVFSTPPSRVLGIDELRRAEPDAMILDLASPPYGVDLEAAWSLGLRAWREPKLPGRYCPFSAARALMRAILRAEAKIDEEGLQ